MSLLKEDTNKKKHLVILGGKFHVEDKIKIIW